jgi:hypothetical protein
MTDSRAGLRLARPLTWQADQCRVLGSPLYARLLSRAAKNAEAGGMVFEILRTQHRDPYSSSLGLRFMGAIHRIVLDGRAEPLAAHYPSVGGDPALKHLWRDFSKTLVDHQDELRVTARNPVQTNEVGRRGFGRLSPHLRSEPTPTPAPRARSKRRVESSVGSLPIRCESSVGMGSSSVTGSL